jgi:flagellin-like hook-associated protein FlgL
MRQPCGVNEANPDPCALAVQYEEQISALVDLDHNMAISDISKNHLQLQAAMQSFFKVTGLSLFNDI